MKKILSLVLVLVLILGFSAVAFPEPSPQNDPPPEDVEEIIEDYQTIYRLTIHYIYLDGTTAAPNYTEQLGAGKYYSVTSPVISGYTATMVVVSGVMPARDMEYTVIYIPGAVSATDPNGPSFLTIEDYETPLGFGASFMHEGICIE